MSKDFHRTYGSWGLVAGASEGLGAAFSEALARRGVNLILLARRLVKLKELASELRAAYKVEIIVHPIDLNDYLAAKQFVADLEKPVGIFIYNAAYSPIGYFENVSEENLDQIVNVNIKTPLLMTKLLSNQMIQRKRGGIVLMSSLAGAQGSPKIVTYSASKAFNSIFAEGIWHELKQHHIDVIASCAGAVSTPGYQQAQNTKTAPGTLSPSQVAEKTLYALGNGPTIVPGFTNKLIHFLFARIFPRKWAIAIMNNSTKHLT